MTRDANRCPRAMQIALFEYANNHIPRGGFLTAVLENNLLNAVRRADENNLEALPHIVAFCDEHLTARCWGSPRKVAEWLARRTP